MRLFLISLILMMHYSASAQVLVQTPTVITGFLDTLTADTYSGTVLYAEGDSIIERRAYGLANIEYNVPNRFDTKFNTASITKMITATAALQLHEAGQLDLHAPVGKYLPDYPNKTIRDSATVHHFLSHQGGTKGFFSEKYLTSEKAQFKTVSDFVPLFIEDTLLFSPGEKYHYNGTGFVLTALIIEQITGMNYYDYVAEKICKPTGMINTAALAPDSIVYNRASGYTRHLTEDGTLRRNDYFVSKAAPSAGYYSTAEDLFRFITALKNHELLNQTTTELMLTPKVKGYNTYLGYGIDLDTRYPQKIIGHSGGWYGVRGEVMHFVESDITVVLLANVDDSGDSGVSLVSEFMKKTIAGKKEEK